MRVRQAQYDTDMGAWKEKQEQGLGGKMPTLKHDFYRNDIGPLLCYANPKVRVR